MELKGESLTADLPQTEVTEDPKLEAENEEEASEMTDTRSEKSFDKEPTGTRDFRMPLIVGVAVVALSAVYVALKRFFSSHKLADGRHEAHPKRALVSRPSPHRREVSGSSPNNNLTFVVPEEYVKCTSSKWSSCFALVSKSSLIRSQTCESIGRTI